MQKSMKRLLSIILSFTMLFSSNCIAYGADEENVNNRAEKARVESLNESDEVRNQIYRILNIINAIIIRIIVLKRME